MLLANFQKRTAANAWKDVVQWKQAVTLPKAYGELEVQECKPELFMGCDVIFSGLDSGVAKQREMEFLKADFAVFSNAKDYRQDVSLLAINRNAPARADSFCSPSSLWSYPLSISHTSMLYLTNDSNTSLKRVF